MLGRNFGPVQFDGHARMREAGFGSGGRSRQLTFGFRPVCDRLSDEVVVL